MHLSVDIIRIKNHISILQEEQREAQSLVEYLNIWKKQNSLDKMVDPSFLEKHIQIVQKQVLYIQRRIVLLESMADGFADAKLFAENLLDDAIDAINS